MTLGVTKERTLYNNGRLGFTHHRVRKAWGIHHGAAHVYTFADHGNLRTTSPLDGDINAQIRHLLRHHRVEDVDLPQTSGHQREAPSGSLK